MSVGGGQLKERRRIWRERGQSRGKKNVDRVKTLQKGAE